MDTNGKMEQPKRRACDECRGRKLACTKEGDGCGRCKREGIKCVYSPQKRMGRPRKHRAVEPATPAPVPAIESKETPNEAFAAAVIPEFEFDSTIGMDLDFSFLDMNNMDVNFLDLVDPNSELLPEFLPAPDQTITDPDLSPYSETPEDKESPRGVFWPMNDHLGDINFDPPSTAPPLAPEFTTEELAQIMSADLAETLPSLSPPSSNSPSTYSSPQEHGSPQPPCGCLASLYLALDSLQTLPEDVGEAMKVARTATKTAHDTILCPVCSDPPIEPVCRMQVTSLQSMMMLGALLPSLSNAYMRILGMVDAEASAADAARRTITFTLKGYGGIWGWMANQGATRCGGAERLEGAVLEPVLWRLTVRALLKLDVYGINEMTGPEDCGDAQQPGLKDIINLMEERSRQRHSQMDELVASGAMPKPSGEYMPLSSGDKPTCMRIIDIAKRSMDDLVIP